MKFFILLFFILLSTSLYSQNLNNKIEIDFETPYSIKNVYNQGGLILIQSKGSDNSLTFLLDSSSKSMMIEYDSFDITIRTLGFVDIVLNDLIITEGGSMHINCDLYENPNQFVSWSENTRKAEIRMFNSRLKRIRKKLKSNPTIEIDGNKKLLFLNDSGELVLK